MKNLNYLNDKRVKLFKDIDDLGDEYNGAFRFRVNGSPVLVIASNGDGWEHVSVSQPNRIPSWETMCIIKDMFFEEEEVVMQLHPKKSQYVNFNEKLEVFIRYKMYAIYNVLRKICHKIK